MLMISLSRFHRLPYPLRNKFCLHSVSLLSLMILSLIPHSGYAFRFRVNQTPNGQSLGCAACHFNAAGGGAINSFGYDVRETLSGGDVRRKRITTGEAYWVAVVVSRVQWVD